MADDAADAYALRMRVECEALRQSVPRLDADDIALAQSFIERLEVETDYAEMGKLNRGFHMALYVKAFTGA